MFYACLVLVRPSPPIDGLKGHWPVSRRNPEPRRFFGDPASLARDNIFALNIFKTKMTRRQKE